MRRAGSKSLTREFGCAIIASDDLVQRARTEAASTDADFAHLAAQPPQAIRGLEQPLGDLDVLTRMSLK